MTLPAATWSNKPVTRDEQAREAYCEHCANEDRPASAPDEGWHCSTEGTDGHTEGLVLVRIDDPSFHHFLCRRRVLGSSVAVRAIILVVNEGSLHFWVLGKV